MHIHAQKQIHTHRYIHTDKYTYTYTYTYTHIYICTAIYMHIYIYIHVYICIHRNIHAQRYYTHIHTYCYIYTYIHIHIYTYTYTEIHIDTHIYIYIYIYTYVLLYIHTCKHIHIHAHKYKYLILVSHSATEIPNITPIVERRKPRLREARNQPRIPLQVGARARSPAHKPLTCNHLTSVPLNYRPTLTPNMTQICLHHACPLPPPSTCEPLRADSLFVFPCPPRSGTSDE